MDSATVQLAIVIAIVALAGLFLARRAIGLVRSRSGTHCAGSECTGCGQAGSRSTEPDPKTLVTIEELAGSAKSSKIRDNGAVVSRDRLNAS
jgi:hypothetical protein